MLIDAWRGHAVRTDTATIYLEAGKDYQLKAEYYDNRDYAVARLQWRIPQVGKVTRLDLYGEAGKAVRECETVVAVLGIKIDMIFSFRQTRWNSCRKFTK